MSSRASGGALAACLIAAAIVGSASGAYVGSRAQDGGPDDEMASQTTPGGNEAPADGDPETSPDNALTLTAEVTSVAPKALIPISGKIRPAEPGIEVKTQRRVEGGEWEDFPKPERPITLTTRDDGTFGGSVSSTQAGQNSFRVVNIDDESMVSNEVEITVDG